MKWFMIVLILAVVLIAGCIQQTTNTVSNQTEAFEQKRLSKNLELFSADASYSSSQGGTLYLNLKNNAGKYVYLMGIVISLINGSQVLNDQPSLGIGDWDNNQVKSFAFPLTKMNPPSQFNYIPDSIYVEIFYLEMNTSVEKKDEGLITVSHPEQPQQGQIGPILALGNLSTPNGKQISNNYFTFRKSEMYDPTTNGYGSPRITVSLNNGNTEIKDITFSFQCWKGSDLILDSKNGELKDLMGGTSLLEVTYNTSNIWISAFTRFNRNTKSKGTVMNTGSYTGTRILTLPVDSRVDFILELLTYKLDATTEFTCKVDFTSSNPSYSLSTDKFTIFYIVDQVQTPLKSVEDKACEQVMKNPNGCMAANPNFIILGTEDIPPFDVNRDGKIDSLDTLQALCENWYMGVAKGDVSTCRKICGCTG